MKEIGIGSRVISHEQMPYFIADIAANHDGDINRAFMLIELAKESGADAAKFQNFKAPKIVSEIGFRSLYNPLSHQANWEKSVYEVYRDASLPDSWTPLLKEKCVEFEIEYMTSPYDFESVDQINDFLNCFKIGSGDISYHQILRHIASKGKPICLATGAATQAEVDNAVEIILEENSQLILMQCNTNYTASKENFHYINLNVLNTYASRYPDIILGLSDHTQGHTTTLGAIALGARVIEKHFTDNNNRSGPDHKFSTTPDEWKTMVEESRNLFNALGDGIKRIEGNEQETAIIQKRGLYVTRTLNKDTVICKEDLIALRPRSDKGFEPWELANLIGKKVNRRVGRGEILKREMVEENDHR